MHFGITIIGKKEGDRFIPRFICVNEQVVRWFLADLKRSGFKITEEELNDYWYAIFHDNVKFMDDVTELQWRPISYLKESLKKTA